MDLAARLDDVAAGPEHDLLVLRPEADLALEDDRVLVLERVDVRRHECPDRERVLDDRERAAGVLAVDLEDDADARREPAGAALARLDHLEPRTGRDRVLLIAMPRLLVLFG